MVTIRKKLTLRALLAAALTALATTPASAQEDVPRLEPPALERGMSDGAIAEVMAPWLRGLNGQGRLNGAVLVARNGREIFAAAEGVQDIASARPLDLDTRFAVASIGKAFTHVAVLQLVQSGRLSLSTRIEEVIADYPNAVSRSATVEQLLYHRAGVADIFGPAFRERPKDTFTSNHAYYSFVASQPPLFAPGAGEEYCNGCYVVLGEMVERVSGTAYEDYVARHVFAPAGMSRSGFFRHDQLPDNAARFTGRPMGPDGPLVDVAEWHGVAGSAAGNAYATVRDLLAFDKALREGRLLNADLTAAVLRGRAESGRSSARIGFAGGGPGVNTMLIGDGAWTVIILTNREPPMAEAIGQTVFPLLAGPRSP
jgi:CubicO group peptidase (beta-lactamase class C family)